MKNEERKLVQVTFKSGLYFSIEPDYEEGGRKLKRIEKYDAIAVYQTEGSSYGSVCIQPIPAPIDANGGYVIPDSLFGGFVKSLSINDIVENIRVLYLDGFHLDDCLILTFPLVKDYCDFAYREMKSAYIDKYGEPEEE